MPDTKPENPPAFPTHSVGKEPGTAHFQESHGGMTLRDYFAAKAMPMIFADGNLRECATELAGKPGNGDVPYNIARLAYRYADAMLQVRARNGGAS